MQRTRRAFLTVAGAEPVVTIVFYVHPTAGSDGLKVDAGLFAETAVEERSLRGVRCEPRGTRSKGRRETS
jgi:hypothetical protein